MSAGDEIIMAAPKSEALVHAEIHAMRQVADAISLQGKQTVEHMAASTRALEKLSDKVDAMNTRLVRLEEAKHGREIERLEGELDAIAKRVSGLEKTRDRQEGASSLVAWILKHWPGMVAFLAMIAVVLKANGKI